MDLRFQIETLHLIAVAPLLNRSLQRAFDMGGGDSLRTGGQRASSSFLSRTYEASMVICSPGELCVETHQTPSVRFSVKFL